MYIYIYIHVLCIGGRGGQGGEDRGSEEAQGVISVLCCISSTSSI